MKKMLAKTMLPAIGLSLLFAVPTTALESAQAPAAEMPRLPGDLAFQIPANNYCSADNALDFSFQLSNASDTAADITVYFYQKDGTAFNEEGTSYREIESNFTPGTPFRLEGNATGLYHINFGNHKRCSERVYLGKIVANSGTASLLARGWVQTRNGPDVIGTELVSVNENKTFQLASPPAK